MKARLEQTRIVAAANEAAGRAAVRALRLRRAPGLFFGARRHAGPHCWEAV